MVLALSSFQIQPSAGAIKGVQRISVVGALILGAVREPLLLQIFRQLMPVRFTRMAGQKFSAAESGKRFPRFLFQSVDLVLGQRLLGRDESGVAHVKTAHAATVAIENRQLAGQLGEFGHVFRVRKK